MSTVLIVEDDPSVVRVLTTVLGSAGHEVVVAHDGLAGLLKLDTLGVDALVLDLAMPDVGGLRVLSQLAEEHGGQLPLPVLIVTGADCATRKVADWVDPRDVFTKPFDPDALLQRLHDHLATGRSQP